MNESNDRNFSRRIVREVEVPEKHTRNVQIQEENTIEICHVIHVVKEYGRKTHSIGAMQGACAMQSLIDNIRALGPQSEEVQTILDKGERDISELRSYMHKAYK